VTPRSMDKRASRSDQLLGDVWDQVQQAERTVLERISVEQLADQQRALEAQRNPMYHI
jgi:DNA-binding IscR family transcriptional regulator